MRRTSLALALGTLLGCRSSTPEPAPAPTTRAIHEMGASSPTSYWLLATTPTQVGALLALMRNLDAFYGYPSVTSDGLFVTQHVAYPRPHPTIAGQWVVPLPATAAIRLAAVEATCAARVDAGVTGVCVAVAQLPPPVATLPASWMDIDASAPPIDAGTLPDPYDGSTP
jgi:hypothetical protein